MVWKIPPTSFPMATIWQKKSTHLCQLRRTFSVSDSLLSGTSEEKDGYDCSDEDSNEFTDSSSSLYSSDEQSDTRLSIIGVSSEFLDLFLLSLVVPGFNLFMLSTFFDPLLVWLRLRLPFGFFSKSESSEDIESVLRFLRFFKITSVFVEDVGVLVEFFVGRPLGRPGPFLLDGTLVLGVIDKLGSGDGGRNSEFCLLAVFWSNVVTLIFSLEDGSFERAEFETCSSSCWLFSISLCSDALFSFDVGLTLSLTTSFDGSSRLETYFVFNN